MPVTPICPIPEINRGRYNDGYNRGFKAGYRDVNNKDLIVTVFSTIMIYEICKRFI